ncbi:MAG: 23S rRNA (guanosine(2251)-2'-O)-methyltransferase RlmB [Chloroflexota bacterium]
MRPNERFEGRPAWAAAEPSGPEPDRDGPPDDRDSRPHDGPGPTTDRGQHSGQGRSWPRDDRRGGPSSYAAGGRRQAPGARPGGGRPWDQPRTYSNAPVPTAEQLGPDEELVAGRRPVEEAFAARRPAHRLLVTPQRRMALERIVLHATTLRIPIVEVEGGTLTSLTGFDGHQGVALVVAQRVFAAPEDLLARAIERGEAPFILVLDSFEDPQNLGTVLRSAEAAGAHGVIFPTVRQAPLSPAAIKASAGATEHLLLCPVDDLAATLTDLHVRGLRIIGTEAEAPLTARQADLRGPIAIIVGSEGHGLAPSVRRRCDLMVRIPMRGAIGSLNAAVAGSVLLFEALGQRDPGARPEARPAELPDSRPAEDASAGSGAADVEDDALIDPTAGPVCSAESVEDSGIEAPEAESDALLPGGPIGSA